MDYSAYKNSRDLAWKVLLNEGVCELLVKTSSLCRKMGITLMYGEQEPASDGYRPR